MTPNYCLQKPNTGVFTNWMKLALIIFTKVECHRSGRILELHTDDCCLHKRIRVDCVHNVSWDTRVTLMRNSIFNWEFKCEMTTKIWLLQWYSTCISIKTLYILVHNNEINLWLSQNSWMWPNGKFGLATLRSFVTNSTSFLLKSIYSAQICK